MQVLSDTDGLIEPRGFDDYDVCLGDELRGERATLGKSLLDVQRDLRIKAAYIAAIENCDPEVFPNKGFIAGYVRSYARYLAIDPDETFKSFCRESGFRGAISDLSGSNKSSKETKVLGQKPDMGELGTMPSIGAFTAKDSFFSHVSPSGLASVSVLIAILGLVTYGGWAVLMDIQRVEFAPVEQAPQVANYVDTMSRDQEIALEQGADIKVGASTDVLAELYRPQELAVPRVAPRDGPIASINPDKVGQLAPVPIVLPGVLAAAPVDALDDLELVGPVVTVAPKIQEVKLFATRAAWVRVSEPDGSVLFEAILEPNDSFVIPPEAQSPLLRAGNSGSVFLAVDSAVFGPVGAGTSVAKNVSLLHQDVVNLFDQVIDQQAPIEEAVTTADFAQ